MQLIMIYNVICYNPPGLAGLWTMHYAAQSNEYLYSIIDATILVTSNTCCKKMSKSKTLVSKNSIVFCQPASNLLAELFVSSLYRLLWPS